MSDAVITQIVQQTETLPANLQQQVLDYVKELAAFVQRGAPGKKTAAICRYDSSGRLAVDAPGH